MLEINCHCFRIRLYAIAELTFECLGHWRGAGGQRFVALMNTHQQPPPSNHIGSGPPEPPAPQYRCATYSSATAATAATAATLAGSRLSYSISFSNDSTCASLRQRTSSTPPSPQSPNGHRQPALRTETLQLFAVAPPRWQHDIFCSYPDWMRGRWQHMEIDQSTIVYRDHNSFKTYTMRCVENEIGSERFLVVSRTQW